MLLRATRLWRMSPQMATLSPSIRLNRSRRVRMSSRPWVGCSCLPSPALMTLERMRWPRNCAAPDAPWRMTTMSIRMASRFRAVSTRVSPLETDEPATATFTVSALSRFSANSNEIRVRVRGLEEQVDDGLPAKRRHLLDRPLAHFLERLRGVEDEPDLVRAQRLQADQVLAEARGASSQARTSSTASRPSSSETNTSTRSAGSVLAVVPTMSAWIGSSRPPRSMSTQSRIRRGRPKSAHSSSAARTVRPV